MWSNHKRPQSSSQYVKFGVHCRSNRKLAYHRLSWVTAGIRTLLLCPHRNWISVKRIYSTLEYFVYSLMNIFNILGKKQRWLYSLSWFENRIRGPRLRLIWPEFNGKKNVRQSKSKSIRLFKCGDIFLFLPNRIQSNP